MNVLGLWGGNPALIIQLDKMDNAIQSMGRPGPVDFPIG